jgi:nucleoside-diphosphate-sugar epimerase
MNNINVLVLGSEGAIGKHLVSILPDCMPTANIIRVSRSDVPGNPYPSSSTLLVGDLLNMSFVSTIFEQYDIQVVIYCAAKWNGLNQDPTVLDVNVTMFNNVLASLPDTVSNFIYLSSSSVYPQEHCSDYNTIELLPSSTYGKSKLINEILLLNKAEITGLAVTIYRPFHVVSPYESYCPGRSHITTDFVHRYIEFDTDFHWNSLSRDVFIPFYWVDDLCKIIVNNIFNQKFVGKVFNIGASHSFSVVDLAICVATVANKYGLSSKTLPELKAGLVPIENKMVSSLNDIVTIAENKNLLEIVERFITGKYGIAYEC